jgi:hypothetical protein
MKGNETTAEASGAKPAELNLNALSLGGTVDLDQAYLDSLIAKTKWCGGRQKLDYPFNLPFVVANRRTRRIEKIGFTGPQSAAEKTLDRMVKRKEVCCCISLDDYENLVVIDNPLPE